MIDPLLRCKLGAVEVAAQVDVDDRLPVVFADVFGRLDDVDACVIHKDVDPPERLDRRLDELATTVAVTRVDLSRKRGAAGCIDGGGGFFRGNHGIP